MWTLRFVLILRVGDGSPLSRGEAMRLLGGRNLAVIFSV